MKTFKKDIKLFGSKENVRVAIESYKENDQGSISFTRTALSQKGYIYSLAQIERLAQLV